MKTWKKWLVGITLTVLVAILGVGIWQKENIQAFWEGMNYTEQELKDEMESTKEKTQEVLAQYELEGIRDLTLEEEEQLMKGELTVEEALDLIMNKEDQPTEEEAEALGEKYDLDKPNGSNNAADDGNAKPSTKPSTSTNGSAATTESAKAEAKQIVENYVGKMYTLQATFLSDLGAIEAKARATFAKLPKEERNLATAKKLAPTFINEGLALESKCDGAVNALLNGFEAELKAVGADTAVVKTMRDAYQTQKRLKKSYYLSAIK